MSEFVRTIIIMSITSSILAVMLFALKPLVRSRLPKAAQYYLWLVVVMALLVPVSRFIVLPGDQAAPIPAVPIISETVARFVITQAEETERLQSIALPAGVITPEYLRHRQETQSPIAFVTTYFVLIYPIGVLMLALYFAVNYLIFVGLYRRRNYRVGPGAEAMLADMCRGLPPRLYRNPLATTPMLLGVFRPAIILPNQDYSASQLKAILAHELVHLRRKDTLVKWLTLAAAALHWFNPMIWLVRREIDRACELSCDEAVIGSLDASGKKNYGNTLIFVAANPKAPRSVISATMCEEKKNLKERLGSIMRSKTYTKIGVTISVVLLIAAAGVAVVLGLGSGTAPIINNYTDDTDYAYNTVIHLYIADVDDALRDSFDSYYSFDYREAHISHWGGDVDWLIHNYPIAIWANVPLRDFEVIGLYLTHNDNGAILATRTHAYYTIGLLDTPLVMEWYFFAGLFPNNGIAFTDPDGVRRFFAIRMAYGHEDNVHELIEFENGGVLFPPWDEGTVDNQPYGYYESASPDPQHDENYDGQPDNHDATEASDSGEPTNTVNHGTPVTFPGVITLDRVSEEDMAAYPDALRFSWIEGAIWMMFRFDAPIRDVTIVGISNTDFDEEAGILLYDVGMLVFEAGDLAAGQPLFIETIGHFGTLPGQAIGFTYTDGVRYYIPFDESQMDGSLVLHMRTAFTID